MQGGEGRGESGGQGLGFWTTQPPYDSCKIHSSKACSPDPMRLPDLPPTLSTPMRSRNWLRMSATECRASANMELQVVCRQQEMNGQRKGKRQAGDRITNMLVGWNCGALRHFPSPISAPNLPAACYQVHPGLREQDEGVGPNGCAQGWTANVRVINRHGKESTTARAWLK